MPCSDALLDAGRLAARARKARLVFADDNPAVLHQVRALLEQGFEIVALFPDGESLLYNYEQLKPDAIILDISMGDINGLDVARILHERGCQTPIVFLTVHQGQDFVDAALSVGGLGYVLKTRMGTDLAEAIRAALDGKPFISSGSA